MSEAHPSHYIKKLTRAVYVCVLVLCIFIVITYLIHPSFVRSINNKATDVIMSFKNPDPSTVSVAIVDIDDKSLAKYGQWPWSRYRLAQLMTKIQTLGASSIGINIILAEPDRTSPNNWQSETARELGYAIDISKIPPEMADHDRYFAETLSHGPFVLGYEFLFNGNVKNNDCKLHPVKPVVVTSKNVRWLKSDLFIASDVTCNKKIFSDSVSYSGFLNATPDSDGILRRVPLLIRFKDQLYPSFALASLMQSDKMRQIQTVKEQNGLLNVFVKGNVIPLDTHGNVAINFTNKPGTIVKVSATDLLEDVATTKSLAGKIVLVGSSAAGLGKVYKTATMMIYSDVELHARVIENLLSGQNIIRTNSFLLWESLVGTLVALIVWIAIARMELLGSVLIAAILISVSWIGPVLLFLKTGRLFSPLLPTLLVLLFYTLLIILKSWKNQQYARQTTNDTLILLKSSENYLDSIIKSVPDIIFRLDLSGRITFISQAISKYSDTPSEFIGRPILELVVPDDLDKAKYRFNEKRTGERATHGLEIRLLLSHHSDENSNEYGVFSISAEGIYCGENPNTAEFIGTQGIIRDITEQKKLEERLLHAEKMEVVGNLAAGVAHDLNNVLCGLVAYPELLLLELPEDNPLRDKVIAIQKSGQKAAAIVEDLLTLARRGVKIAEVVSLNAIVSDYLASLEFEAMQKRHANITIKTHLAPDLMTVMGSQLHLSKSIMNILNNAAEAMPAGGTISISSCNRCLDATLSLYEQIPAGEYVCLEIADEGVGIASNDLNRIFEPFFSKKSMKRSGSGLGMTIIWATIKDYNGYLDIQSTEGEGTQIVVYLPSNQKHGDSISNKIGLEEYLGSEHVHVVDDMPEQAEIAAKMLTKLGYTVTMSSSGEAAVEFVRHNKPDLVVLDMIMPGGIDGLEAYKKIIEIHPGQKVIIVSGFSESDQVKAVQLLGAGSYVQKPYTLEKIGVAVRMELDKVKLHQESL